MHQKILFICTGNYYRSRFAEMLFNAYASREGLAWEADSRGIELGIYNVGPVYPLVLKRLETLGIFMESKIRLPLPLELDDLQEASLIVALDEIEHKPMMVQRFTLWADQILYWNIPDLHRLSAEEAFSQIEKKITTLIRQLADHGLP